MNRLVVIACVCVLTASTLFAQEKTALPPGENDAKAAIEKSPRHGEYVDVKVEGREKPVKAYVVFPEVKDKAPVVIVIHEIYGLSDWIRGVADQLAAEGFIAIAPDLISGMGPNGGGTDAVADRDGVVKLVKSLKPDDVVVEMLIERQTVAFRCAQPEFTHQLAVDVRRVLERLPLHRIQRRHVVVEPVDQHTT